MKEVVSPYSHLSQSRLLRPVASMMGWMAQGCVASCPEKERKVSKFREYLENFENSKNCHAYQGL